MEDIIYLDNAATTQTKEEVINRMQPFFSELYGNAASIYRFAGKATKAVDEARQTVADFIGAKRSEIYFTSGGSESDNWAIKGVAYAMQDKGRHIITTKIEHHAVLNTCEFLKTQGFEITYLDVDENGLVGLDELEAAIRDDTILISVMFANNEIGTIEPIAKIGSIAHKRGVIFHTDAVQAYGHVPINVSDMNIDILSASGHKFGGPKGVGIIYLKDTVKISPLIHGGAQERGKRAGTHNTPGIVGFAVATEIANKELNGAAEYVTELRDYLINRIESEIPYCRLNLLPRIISRKRKS